MSPYINVNFHYLPNETNLRFVAITVLELQAITYFTNMDITKNNCNFLQFYIMVFLYQFIRAFLTIQLNFYKNEISCVFDCVSRCVCVCVLSTLQSYLRL